MEYLSVISAQIMLVLYLGWFVVAAYGAAGLTELIFFSLGLEQGQTDVDDKPVVIKGRIFSFFGKYWPIKCPYCFNFWVSAGVFAALYFACDLGPGTIWTFIIFAGISHSRLKIVKFHY